MQRVKHLQNRVRLQQALSEGSHTIIGGTGDRVVEEDLLGGFGFTCATLSGYKNTLVLPLSPHGPIGVVRQGVAGGGEQRRSIMK